MKYYFYMVRCADDSLYCGIATDLEKRIKEHNSKTMKAAKYTRAKQPVVLVYSKRFKDRSSALKREAEVKKWTKLQKESLIKYNSLKH
ncbi:GIY-YIG nuclease family protein [Candidatus Roizmanbacteria bacterium]|nr:GIY-YIG nuclease family protein [Candidatus Roizmanbacteria bacterium]